MSKSLRNRSDEIVEALVYLKIEARKFAMVDEASYDAIIRTRELTRAALRYAEVLRNFAKRGAK